MNIVKLSELLHTCSKGGNVLTCRKNDSIPVEEVDSCRYLKI